MESHDKVARAASAFIEGSFYNKDEIWPKFKVGARGGIRPNKQDNLVVVFIDAPSNRKIADFGRNIYADGYDDSKGLYRYTGEGQSGDQEFTRGNKWLRDAAAKGTQIHLFYQNENGKKHQYIGQVTVSSYTFELQKDAQGNNRRVIVFWLKPKSPSKSTREENASTISDYASLRKFITDKMDMHANYQPVMIKALLTLGRASRQEIAQNLLNHNPENPKRDFERVPVYEVLERHRIVKREGEMFSLYASSSLTSEQISELEKLCEEKIAEFSLSSVEGAIEQEDPHDYSPMIGRFLEDRYSVDCLVRLRRNTLQLPSGAVIHTKKSSETNSWYGLDKKIFDEFMQSPDLFLALSLDGPEKTFVIPKSKISEIFESELTIKRPGRDTDRWMIRIRRTDGKYILKLDHSKKSHEIGWYLNRWSQVPDFTEIKLDKVTESIVDKAIESDDVELVGKVLTGDRKAVATQRQGQAALRKAILRTYDHKCALCDVSDDDMLIASHIVPWSEDKEIRGVLENVICLCRFHDGLFESGKLIIQDDYEVTFSKSFMKKCNSSKAYHAYRTVTSGRLRAPLTHPPQKEHLQRHRRRFVSEEYDYRGGGKKDAL